MPEPTDAGGRGGIDPRGPRFAAAITSLLLLVAVFLSLTAAPATTASFGWFAYQPLANVVFVPGTDFAFVAGSPWALLAFRAAQPAFVLLVVIALLFLWGAAWPRTAPWGVLYRRLVQPRLRAPEGLEDPRPPRFAQVVGLIVVTVGLVLHLVGVPWALTIAAAVAFVAAFLNAAFGVCLGCLMWLGMQRLGLVGRDSASPA